MDAIDQFGMGLFVGGLIVTFALMAYDIYTDWRNSK